METEKLAPRNLNQVTLVSLGKGTTSCKCQMAFQLGRPPSPLSHEQIMKLLAKCKKSTNENAKAKLINLARQLETACIEMQQARRSTVSSKRTRRRCGRRLELHESQRPSEQFYQLPRQRRQLLCGYAGASVTKKIKEQHLRICGRGSVFAPSPWGRCRVPIGQKCQVTPHCAVMQKLWQHIAQCKEQRCSYPHCGISTCRTLRRCSDLHCLVPVRHAIQH